MEFSAPIAIKQLKAAAKTMKAAAKKGAGNKKSPKPPEKNEDGNPNAKPLQGPGEREPGSDDDK